MCGIVGIGGYRNDELVRRMCKTIVHRGPDDYGMYFSDNHSLGMQRLSIIDLEHGHQPMTACGGKVIIVFNGEIYNYQEIRDTLIKKGHTFKTHSDTETILNGYLEWGLDFVQKLIGMFAIALSDQRQQPVLYLVRDRIGVKPLYYHYKDRYLTFGSEIKAILANSNLSPELNPLAVHHYLKLRYVPGEQSLIKDINKLPPGNILIYSKGTIKIQKYWEVCFEKNKFSGSFDEALEKLQYLMETSIKRRLVADVPVGAYLSGGVDSSLIVALMAQFHEGPVNTFSIGFKSCKDETSEAKFTANVLGTNHHEIICDDSDFKNIDKIVWHLDEPIGDAIVLPMYLLAKKAREHVKVILAGEGADELFGGYLFHKVLRLMQNYKKLAPKFSRKMGQKAFNLIPHQMINLIFEYPADLGRDGKKKISSFLQQIEKDDITKQYRGLISLFSDKELFSKYHEDFKYAIEKQEDYLHEKETSNMSITDQFLAAQYRDWLPDDILMKLDKMTMANSLEGREPFLDHELVNYVNNLPNKFKIKGWKDKYILRCLAKKYLPSEIVTRKKKPFYMPIDEYFKKPIFKNLFDSFKEENYLKDIFHHSYLNQLNLENTTLLHSKRIFSLMILNIWFKQFLHH